MTIYSLKIQITTVLKQQPINSSQISDPTQKQDISAGQELALHSYLYDPVSNHYKVAFLSNSFQGKNTWWVYAEHVQILKDGVVVPKGATPSIPTKVAAQSEVKLNVPYFCQLDNSYNPYGCCNVTSMAMCLTYLGIRPKDPKVQLEDELYKYCETNGLDRHNPVDLAKLVQDYGCKDNFRYDAPWADVKKWLTSGNPTVTHGYFTKSGHIVTIIGFNADGWIVNDPYGEWYADGYDTNVSGANLSYSYAMMDQTCGPDGKIWMHFISK